MAVFVQRLIPSTLRLATKKVLPLEGSTGCSYRLSRGAAACMRFRTEQNHKRHVSNSRLLEHWDESTAPLRLETTRLLQVGPLRSRPVSSPGAANLSCLRTSESQSTAPIQCGVGPNSYNSPIHIT